MGGQKALLLPVVQRPLEKKMHGTPRVQGVPRFLL